MQQARLVQHTQPGSVPLMASQVEEIKWLPSDRDWRFMVDGFAFAKCQPHCKTHFLTHFHSDHTIGLPKHFHQGTIYCSEVTAQLLLHDMGLQPASCVVALPMHTPVEVEGCRVTLVEANHCPGAVMLVVEVVRGRTPSGPHFILHTGDFRWADWMAAQVLSATGGVGIDTLFLDTTYCMPRYTFPPQDTVLDALADEVRAALAQEPASLLVVGAYHIGKEKVYLGLAKRLGLKVWVTPAKRRVLELLALPADDLALLTHSPADAQLHVSNWGLRPDKLRDRFLQGGVQGAAADPLSSVPPRASLADKGETGEGSAAAGTAAAVAGGAVAAGDAAAGGAAAGGAAATAAAAAAAATTAGAAAAATTAGAAAAATTAGAAAARVPSFEQELESEGSGADWGSWAGGPPLQQSVSSDGPGLSKEGSTGEEEVDMVPACAGQWRAVVAVRATGWSFRKKGGLISRWVAGPDVLLLGAPYSEHSAWPDLCACVSVLAPRKLVPTVNAETPAASQRLVDRLARFMDLKRNRGRMDMYLWTRGNTLSTRSNGTATVRAALDSAVAPLPLVPGDRVVARSLQPLLCNAGSGGPVVGATRVVTAAVSAETLEVTAAGAAATVASTTVAVIELLSLACEEEELQQPVGCGQLFGSRSDLSPAPRCVINARRDPPVRTASLVQGWQVTGASLPAPQSSRVHSRQRARQKPVKLPAASRCADQPQGKALMQRLVKSSESSIAKARVTTGRKSQGKACEGQPLKRCRTEIVVIDD
ncbi:beta-lactamase-like protein [Haematococcus lacustris]